MKNIKDLRREFNLTQEELAKGLNVSRSTVTNWEREQVMMSGKNLIKVSNFFNISADVLLGIKLDK